MLCTVALAKTTLTRRYQVYHQDNHKVSQRLIFYIFLKYLEVYLPSCKYIVIKVFSYKTFKSIFIHFNYFCGNVISLTRFINTQAVNYFFYFSNAGFFFKFSTESKLFFFMLIILRFRSNIFVATDNGLLIALSQLRCSLSNSVYSNRT